MGKRIDFGEIVAKKKLSPLPENWEIYAWELCGPDAVIYTGSECKRGPRSGKRQWYGQKQSAVVTKAEWDAAAKEYERATGFCWVCGGDGQAWKGWSRKDGDYFEFCKKCNGTGKAPVEVDE